MLGGDISNRYNGALCIPKSMPSPSKRRPPISMSTFTAKELMTAPARKTTPPIKVGFPTDGPRGEGGDEGANETRDVEGGGEQHQNLAIE